MLLANETMAAQAQTCASRHSGTTRRKISGVRTRCATYLYYLKARLKMLTNFQSLRLSGLLLRAEAAAITSEVSYGPLSTLVPHQLTPIRSPRRQAPATLAGMARCLSRVL